MSTRNKLIAEAFYLTSQIEKYGSGYIRIRRELTEYPELVFSVEEMSGGVLVTFSQCEGVNEGVNEGVSGGVSGGGSGGVNELLKYILLHPGKNTLELTAALEVPQRTMQRRIKALRESGCIEFRGADKTGGYYAVEPEKT